MNDGYPENYPYPPVDGELEYSFLYEAETNLLGSIMLDKTLMEDCPLTPESFSPEWKNGLIFQVLKFAYDNFSNEPDPFYVPMIIKHYGVEKLRKIGGASTLMEIRHNTPPGSSAMFKNYMQVVNEAHVDREIFKAAQEMASGKMTVEQMKDRTSELERLRDRTANDTAIVSMGELIQQHTTILFKRSQVKDGITGAKSFSAGINRLTKGYQNGDLVIVGARPSVGKTAYLCNEAMAITEDNTAVLIISGEDGAMNLFERTISGYGMVPLAHMKSGKMTNPDWEKYTEAGKIIGNRNIFIDDTPSPTIESIKRKVLKMIKQYPKMVLLVDYLQHLKSEKTYGSERELYKYISYELKQIARRFNIPVISLAAVKRDVDTRPDKRPLLSDVRDCGNIESDADVLMFLYRDDYYNANSDRKGLMDIIIAKGRNTGTGTVTVLFDKQHQKLHDLTEYFREKRKKEGLSVA